MRMISWCDPNENGEPEYHCITEEEAVELMEQVAEQMGKPYNSYEEALWDFIVVNWAEVSDDGF